MKRFRMMLLTILFCVMGTNMIMGQQMPAPQIIPEPVSVQVVNGKFTVNPETVIRASGAGVDNSVNYLREYISNCYGLSLEQSKKKAKANCIVLEIKKDKKAVEGAYSLSVSPHTITITGYNESGLFYGVQTLIQLLPVDSKDKNLNIQAIVIEDEPRFEYRGMHLDVVRHIFPIEYIKKYIDYIALHKMNYFHWHLTDDQGWRMESKSHPRLNEYGAYRESTIIGVFPGTGVDHTRYGGYYTIEEMKEVVEYATKRYVTVVPEIDVPGHSMAILAAYPEFGTEPDKETKPATTWNIYNRQNNVLAPREETFQFLEDVFNELMDVFPGKYIHIGADECAFMWWKQDPLTQQFMKEHNMTDEAQVQAYFSKRIHETVSKRGRVALGWDEIIDHDAPKDMIPLVWRDARSAAKAVKDGYYVIQTPMKYCYLNAKQREDEKDITYPMAMTSIDKVYGFELIPENLAEDEQSRILGGQGCMWTEYYESPERIDYSVLPRMSVLSEVFWSRKENRDLEKFKVKLQSQFLRYDLWGAHYCDFERRAR